MTIMKSISIQDVEEMMKMVVKIPSVTYHEDQIRNFLMRTVIYKGAEIVVDSFGNVIVKIPGSNGREKNVPLLYTAHMDRVPPGNSCSPKVEDGVMYGDGKTNLGADDAAGITIIVLAAQALIERNIPHNPLVLLFTVQEEVGLKGAHAFDPVPWGVREGIVFDNAGEPGCVVTRGLAYIAFDAVIHGRGGHPGKDLAGTLSAIEVLRKLDLPVGIQDDGATRINIGMVQGGKARNQIAEEVIVQGELRTLLESEGQERWKKRIEASFQDAAASLGGTAQVGFDPHGSAYEVDEQEHLVQLYRNVWEDQGQHFQTMDTFVGSDTNELRQRLRVFTVSTGAKNEHTLAEYIALQPLADMAEAAVSIANLYDK